MMFASLNGVRCYSLTIITPPRGLWEADAELTDAMPTLTGAATLIVAGLTMTGFIYRAGNFLDDCRVRMVGGYGGWNQNIPARPYKNPFGLKLKQIATDAATAAGEQINVTADRDIGTFYVRANTTAKRVLNQLAPNWWVGADGVTQVGPRPNTTIVSPFDVLADGTDLGIGRVAIATDKPEDWSPGFLFSAPTIPQQMQVSAVVHRLDADKLRTTVWTSP